MRLHHARRAATSRHLLALACAALAVASCSASGSGPGGDDGGAGDDGATTTPPYAEGWSAVHADAANSDHAAVEGPSNVELAWVRQLDGDMRIGDLEWTINLGPTSDPDGQLYVTSTVPGCHLQALDAATGETRWCAEEVALPAVVSSPLVDEDGRLFVADGTAMRAFDRDGEELWSQPIVGVPLSAQFTPGGNVVFVTHVGVVHLLDRATGEPVVDPVELVPDPSWDPGQPLWPCARGTEGCPSANTPAVDMATGRLFFTWWEPGAPLAGIRAMQIDEGPDPAVTDLWTNDSLPGGTGASPTLAPDGSRLYVTDNEGSVHALDAATGETIWTHEIGIAAGGSLSLSPDGLLIPPGGPLLALRDEGDTATEAWRVDGLVNMGIGTQAAGHRAYATVLRAPDELDLVVLDTRTGEVLDRERLEGENRFSVGITLGPDGTVFVPTIVGTLAAFRPAEPPSPPGDEWPTTTPEEAGLDPDAVAALLAEAEAAGSHCVAVVRDGELVVEASWPGPDAEPREVFSITKSLTSVLVGIAERDGLLSVTDPVARYVPEWAGTPSAEVTIEHLLANVSGRRWDLATDYGAMALGAEDKTTFAVGLGQQHEPGTVWAYNNSAIQVLSRVIEEATGVDAAEYAEREVFGPLGMADSELARDAAGNPTTFMGLQSTCTDLARLGQLMLLEGRWGDEQVLSPDFVARATSPSTELNAAYGWLWWVNGDGPIAGPRLATTGEAGDDGSLEGPLVPEAPADTFWALGLHDQVMAVVPAHGIVAVRLGPAPPPAHPFGVQQLTAGVLAAVVDG